MKTTPGENRSGEIFAVVAFFLVLAATGLGLRFESKRIIRKSLLLDDYLVIVAFLILVAEAASFIWATKYGALGHHKASVDLSEIIVYEKVFFTGSILQPCSVALAKMSVLVFLRRIFITRIFRRTVDILMVIVVGWWLSDVLGGILICQPVRSSWNPTIPNSCGNRYLFNLIMPIPWIATDLVILICPLPMVWRLHTSVYHRIQLGGLFLVGTLTTVVCCVRYTYSFFSLEDPTWDSVPLWNWNMVEASVTVFCACLFASKPAVNKLIPEKIISKLGSQSRSWSSSWRNKIPRALHEEGKESIASSPEPPKPAHVGLRRHSQVGGHEDLESHGRGSTAPDVSYSSEKPLPGIPVRGIPAQSAGETMSFTSW